MHAQLVCTLGNIDRLSHQHILRVAQPLWWKDIEGQPIRCQPFAFLSVTQQHTWPSRRSYRAAPVKAAAAESSGQESYIPLGDIREIGV